MMARFTALLVCWGLLRKSLALDSNKPTKPQSLTDTICPGLPRSQCEIELDVPQACATSNLTSSDADPGCPIVFFLHGRGNTNDLYATYSGVHNAGFIGVYPQGEGGWNIWPETYWKCSWDNFNCTEDPNEGEFIASIIAEIRSRGGTGNVYAIGMSNGASLAHRLAANAGATLPIKGIVTQVFQLFSSPARSGPGVLNYNQPGRGSDRVSVLSVMGTSDNVVPYNGGTLSWFISDFQLMSALDSMSAWADHNGCDGKALTEELTSNMGTGATKYNYTGGCPSDIILEHYAINGGGHYSGLVEIDGVSMSFDIAHDFINRVEAAVLPVAPPTQAPIAPPTQAPVVSPTQAPIAPPTQAPVVSPTPQQTASSFVNINGQSQSLLIALVLTGLLL